MKLNRHLIITAALLSATAQGATTFATDTTALAGAEWDTWTSSSATPTTLSQGAANSTFGSLITSSETTTIITQGYDSPPGGFLGNPDTYYFHNGAATWTSNLLLSSSVSFVRVSYSLVGFGGAPPEGYAQSPEITGATVLRNGSYNADRTPAFYTDFALASPSDDISASFGDVVTPGFFPGSFRSIDAIQLEVFDVAPAAIPEPSTGILALLGGLLLTRRRRE